MLANIVAYIIAFIVLAGIEIPFMVITLPLAMAIKKANWLAPLVICVVDIVKMSAAILFASWLIGKIGQSPTWLMYLIPGFLVLQNDRMRISRVNAGQSNVKNILEKAGEPESYDQTQDLWMEWAHLVGDVIGWIIGVNLVLQSAKFL